MSWLRNHLWNIAPLVIAAAALSALGDLEVRPWPTLVVLAVLVAAFVRALIRLGGAKLPTGAVLAVAALLRISLLPLPATLSDDIYRYLWDGRIASAGRNPYFHTPEDPALEDLRDGRWERVAHREVETVYPPLAIAAFSIAARAPWPVAAWKAMLVVVDLLSCALLLRLARARGVPSGRGLAYAWNPLVAVEVAGMGHVDALGILPLLAGALLLVEPRGERPARLSSATGEGAAPERSGRAGNPSSSGDDAPSGVAAVARRRSLAAGAALALAILAKLVPLLLVAAWARAAPRRILFVIAVVGVVAVASAPFAIGAPGPPPGLVTYAVSWEWNGPLFEPLWRALDRAGAAPWVKQRLDDLKQTSGRHDFWNRFYRYVYPQLLAKALLAIALVAAVIVVTWRRRADPIGAALGVFGATLILSATVYPWYALWVLPWAALEWRWPWIVLSLSLFASYLPRLLDVPLLPWPFLLVWGPFLIALSWTRRTAARTAARPTA